MQKLVYVSNSRDFTEQRNVNDNKYLAQINGFLEQGWNICHMTPNTVEVYNSQNPKQNETFAMWILLEKPGEQE